MVDICLMVKRTCVYILIYSYVLRIVLHTTEKIVFTRNSCFNGTLIGLKISNVKKNTMSRSFPMRVTTPSLEVYVKLTVFKYILSKQRLHRFRSYGPKTINESQNTYNIYIYIYRSYIPYRVYLSHSYAFLRSSFSF